VQAFSSLSTARAGAVWVQLRATCSGVTRAVVIEALGQTVDASTAVLEQNAGASTAGEWSKPTVAESFAMPVWDF
jgi:hypothetical protein